MPSYLQCLTEKNLSYRVQKKTVDSLLNFQTLNKSMGTAVHFGGVADVRVRVRNMLDRTIVLESKFTLLNVMSFAFTLRIKLDISCYALVSLV